MFMGSKNRVVILQRVAQLKPFIGAQLHREIAFFVFYCFQNAQELLGGLPEDVIRKVLYETAAKVYGI